MFKTNVLEGLELLKAKVDAEVLPPEVRRDITDLLDKFEGQILDVIEGAEENYARQRRVHEETPVLGHKEDLYGENFIRHDAMTAPVSLGALFSSIAENDDESTLEEQAWAEYGIK